MKGLNGHGLVIHDIEDGTHARNSEYIVNLIREVDQLQVSLMFADTRENTNQMAQADSIDVINIAKIE